MKNMGLIGKKLGMTRIFGHGGNTIPVTVVQAGPCPVIQVKNKSKDGYSALQLGFEKISERRLNKPQRGHQFKSISNAYRTLKEFRLDDVQDFESGQELTVDMFEVGDKVKISGKSKGRGFSGVIRRWNFAGAPASHGAHKVHRSPGAIGQCADPARVFKGKKMPGQLGNQKTTITNAEVVDIRKEDNLILLRGQVPGPNKSVVTIRKIK